MKIAGIKQTATVELDFLWPVGLPVEVELKKEDLLQFFNQLVADKMKLVIKQSPEVALEIDLNARFTKVDIHGD